MGYFQIPYNILRLGLSAATTASAGSRGSNMAARYGQGGLSMVHDKAGPPNSAGTGWDAKFQRQPCPLQCCIVVPSADYRLPTAGAPSSPACVEPHAPAVSCFPIPS